MLEMIRSNLPPSRLQSNFLGNGRNSAKHAPATIFFGLLQRLLCVDFPKLARTPNPVSKLALRLTISAAVVCGSPHVRFDASLTSVE